MKNRVEGWGIACFVAMALACSATSPGEAVHEHPVPAPTLPQGGDSRPLPAPSPEDDPISDKTRAEGTSLSGRILVLAADGKEVAVPAIVQMLEHAGTPYTLRIATEADGPLTPEYLAAGSHGNYQGVILSSGGLSMYDGSGWVGALTPEEWQVLWDYTAEFGVRLVSFYTYPTADYGFGETATALDTNEAPHPVTLTEAGREVFDYLQPDAVVSLRNVYTYLSPPSADATALLTDSEGNALAVTRTHPDGRETLALSFDGASYLTHTVALGHGLLRWLTRGRFVGAFRVYVGVQVDDLFLASDLWGNGTYNGGGKYRMTAEDLQATADWQARVQTAYDSPQIRMDMAFNGQGAEGLHSNDTLTPAAIELRERFKWISHTHTHLNLDAVSAEEATREFAENHRVAEELGLPGYLKQNIVTPQISGLRNPRAMSAAYEQGIRMLVSDTSHADQRSEFINGGLYNYEEPRILMIPRRATNLYYNVSTPAEWASQYNHIHGDYWGRDLSYEEVLEVEGDVLAHYMLKGEIYPWMFHQANLRFFEEGHSTLTDLLDYALEQYGALYGLPILSPPMEVLGERVEQRMELALADLDVTFHSDGRILLESNRAVRVPLTGVEGPDAERYGDWSTLWVDVPPNMPITLHQAADVCEG